MHIYRNLNPPNVGMIFPFPQCCTIRYFSSLRIFFYYLDWGFMKFVYIVLKHLDSLEIKIISSDNFLIILDFSLLEYINTKLSLTHILYFNLEYSIDTSPVIFVSKPIQSILLPINMLTKTLVEPSKGIDLSILDKYCCCPQVLLR